VIADLRLNYTRYSDKLNSLSSLAPASLGISDPSAALFAAAGFTNLGMPQIDIAGMPSFGTQASFPQTNIDNNFNLTNGWNIVMGRNNIHAGFDLWWIRANGFQNFAYGSGGRIRVHSGRHSFARGAGIGSVRNFRQFLCRLPARNPFEFRTQPALLVAGL
jgi:hypothetical protein